MQPFGRISTRPSTTLVFPWTRNRLAFRAFQSGSIPPSPFGFIDLKKTLAPPQMVADN
jgi:hypothetical protein